MDYTDASNKNMNMTSPYCEKRVCYSSEGHSVVGTPMENHSWDVYSGYSQNNPQISGNQYSDIVNVSSSSSMSYNNSHHYMDNNSLVYNNQQSSNNYMLTSNQNQIISPIVAPPPPTTAPINHTTNNDSMQRKGIHLFHDQLLLQLHASRCNKYELSSTITGRSNDNNLASSSSSVCSVPRCAIMRSILSHVYTCSNNSCSVNDCKLAKTLMKHWTNCRDARCNLCEPIRRQLFIKIEESNNTKISNNYSSIQQQQQQQQYNQTTTQPPSFHPSTYNQQTQLQPNEQPSNSNFSLQSPPTYFYSQSNKSIDSSSLQMHSNQEYNQQVHSTQQVDMKSPEFSSNSNGLVLLPPPPPSLPNGDNNITTTSIQPSYSSSSANVNSVNRPTEQDNNSHHSVSFDCSNQKVLHPSPAISQKDELLSSTIAQNNEFVTVKSESTATITMESISSASSVTTTASITPAAASSSSSCHFGTASITSSNNNNINNNQNHDNNNSRFPNLKKWSRDELLQCFMPLYQIIYNLEEALPFHEPVDPVALGILDYFTIIKKPMDLSTICSKLENHLYTEPWEIIDDFWLMFNNAWLYNKKNSRVHRCCTKLAETFEKHIDKCMQSLGYCCGQNHYFQPQVLFCSTAKVCIISRDAPYYYYEKRSNTDIFSEKYYICDKCYNETIGDLEILMDTEQPPQIMSKSLFQLKKNNVKESEKFVICRDCKRKWHQICALHCDDIWKEGFKCPKCVEIRPPPHARVANIFRAKRLPSTRLSNCLEKRVNSYLKKKDAGTCEVTIRVLYSGNKIAEVKPLMKATFCDSGQLSPQFPYKSKAIFAFQEIDGVDVCFFGLYVQEYGSDCPKPNQRRVYVAYLDSVFYFRPRQYRTDVYHEILLGYLQYARHLGYSMAHIWACPPGEGDDYIFHMHPPDQKIPKPKRLQEWYLKLLEKALIERIIVDYRNIYAEAMRNSVACPTEIPYFEGDFWSTSLEDLIKEVEEAKIKQESYEAEEDECIEDQSPDQIHVNSYSLNPSSSLSTLSSTLPQSSTKNSVNKKIKKRKGNKKSTTGSTTSKKKKLSMTMYNGPALLSKKVYELMDKHKDVFFNIRLQPLPSSQLGPIEDPDPFIRSDIMDSRDNFLSQARERHWEFSSLRRAKFSSMILLYELCMEHCPTQYTCNICCIPLNSRWHCNICPDYDLCEKCYSRESHSHTMNFVEESLTTSGGESGGGNNSINNTGHGSGAGAVGGGNIKDYESKRNITQTFIPFLLHASSCRDANCRLSYCQKMKNLINHSRSCRQRVSGQCVHCKNFAILCNAHARQCSDNFCHVPFCQVLRTQLKHQQQRQLQTQTQILKRRIAMMRANNSNSNNNQQQQQQQQGQQQKAQQHQTNTPSQASPDIPQKNMLMMSSNVGGSGGGGQVVNEEKSSLLMNNNPSSSSAGSMSLFSPSSNSSEQQRATALLPHQQQQQQHQQQQQLSAQHHAYLAPSQSSASSSILSNNNMNMNPAPPPSLPPSAPSSSSSFNMSMTQNHLYDGYYQQQQQQSLPSNNPYYNYSQMYSTTPSSNTLLTPSVPPVSQNFNVNVMPPQQQQQQQQQAQYTYTQTPPVRDFNARQHLQEVMNSIANENPLPAIQFQKIQAFLQANPRFVNIYHEIQTEQQQQARRNQFQQQQQQQQQNVGNQQDYNMVSQMSWQQQQQHQRQQQAHYMNVSSNSSSSSQIYSNGMVPGMTMTGYQHPHHLSHSHQQQQQHSHLHQLQQQQPHSISHSHHHQQQQQGVNNNVNNNSVSMRSQVQSSGSYVPMNMYQQQQQQSAAQLQQQQLQQQQPR